MLGKYAVMDLETELKKACKRENLKLINGIEAIGDFYVTDPHLGRNPAKIYSLLRDILNDCDADAKYHMSYLIIKS